MAEQQSITDADREELVAYLDGELAVAEQQRVEERLTMDVRARAEADAFQRTWEMLDYLPRSEPSPAFTERTLDAVSALQPASRTPWTVPAWTQYAGWAATVVAAVGLGYVLTGARTPPPVALVELEVDPLYTQEPRVIDHLPLYLAVDSIEFLRALDDPGLFGDQSLDQ